VDTGRYSPRPSQEKALSVLFASRLLEAKGIYELVEAARVVKTKLPGTRIWIAGEPDNGNPTSVREEDLEAWKKEGVVELLGHQDPIDDWIARSAVVVLPSYREGLPKILLEASSMEKPVVATDVPGCREVVSHGETGLLVKVRDSLSLAEAMLKLLQDENLRQKMGQAGRKKIMADFSADKVIRETMEVYRGFQ
jgi:glycosyltransferase involved in cell wall biosynthesis